MKKQAVNIVGIFVLVLLIVDGILFDAVIAEGQKFRDQEALEARLEFLYDIPEISAIVIKRNNVYLGFDSWNPKISQIVRSAAYHGNKAYGARVHVWGCKVDWKQDNPECWRYFCTATGQNGRVVKSDCR